MQLILSKTRWLTLWGVGLLLLAACGTGADSEPQATANSPTEAPAAAETTATTTPTKAEAESTMLAAAPTENPAPTTVNEEVDITTPEETANEVNESGMMTQDDRPEQLKRLTSQWHTNWNLHTIDYDEILSGGPPRDGIPSIDQPQYITIEEASEWLADNEPVIALEVEGIARAYPLQILTWHEIVNAQIGETPVLITFCPLCNSALVFDRRIDGEVYEFGTSGLLRYSDLIMYDRTTESLWQQFTGEAIVGDMVGHQLTFLPASLVSLADFGDAYPEGLILSRETGFGDAYAQRYGTNPYPGYDTIGRSPFLFDGELDGRLQAVERVVTVSFADSDVAYPLRTLSRVGVINDSPNGHDLVVFHQPGTSSALGSEVIAFGDDVGATGVFDPHVEGQKLTFIQENDQIRDEETGSTWNVLGQATEGPLAGTQLTPIVHGDHFWFSWAAFKPDTLIYE